MERKVRDSCGKSVAWETPQARRGGLPPARGKRVPEVEIIERSHFTNPQKKDCRQQILSSL
nr:hypothetical protein [Peribacillus frigoritolerans]